MPLCLLYITAGNRAEAQKIARALLRERLVACVNILAPVESSYWWEGRIETAQEVLIMAKTQTSLTAAVVRKVKAIHSYAVPCVVALPILQGNPAFLRWIKSESATPLPRKKLNPVDRRASRNG